MPEEAKTHSDHQLLCDINRKLEHLTVDMHALAQRQDRVDRLLTEFEPIIRLYASPVSAYTATRRARKLNKEATANG
jgi:hypothetical protein